MVSQVLNLIKGIFVQCFTWTENLLSAIGGTGIVLSAVAVALLASVFILPIRGGQGGLGMDSSLFDFQINYTSRPRKQEKGLVVRGSSGISVKRRSNRERRHRYLPGK